MTRHMDHPFSQRKHSSDVPSFISDNDSFQTDNETVRLSVLLHCLLIQYFSVGLFRWKLKLYSIIIDQNSFETVTINDLLEKEVQVGNVTPFAVSSSQGFLNCKLGQLVNYTFLRKCTLLKYGDTDYWSQTIN